MPRIRSIQTRVLWSSFGLVTLTALLLGLVTYHAVLRETEGLFDYQLKQMALSLRDQAVVAPLESDLPAPEPTDFVLHVWSADGSAAYYSRYLPDMPATVPYGYVTVTLSGERWRIYSLMFGNRVIRVAQPMSVRRNLAAETALRSVTPLLALAPLFALAAWWMVGFSLAPLRRVANEVKGLRAQALEPLATRGLPSEIEPLVSSLNVLLDRLRGAFETQRAFVADAAHELRSPLTALKLQLQLLRRANDPAVRAEAIERLASGIERAHHLVEQLLTLARSEPGAAPPGAAGAVQPVDIAVVARQAIGDTVAFAAARGVELSLDAPNPGISVDSADASSLRVLVRNLIDNAVRYGREGGQVVVRLESRPQGDVRVLVDDDGPGIPEADRERVFDRFYRRTPGETTGSGLGLAIVRAVAERHAAAVSLDTSPAGGLRACVTFPAARAPAAARPATVASSLPVASA
jgi:two-component system OmpR family sensor kinase/two-component system sensor histidine kinase QseC